MPYYLVFTDLEGKRWLCEGGVYTTHTEAKAVANEDNADQLKYHDNARSPYSVTDDRSSFIIEEGIETSLEGWQLEAIGYPVDCNARRYGYNVEYMAYGEDGLELHVLVHSRDEYGTVSAWDCDTQEYIRLDSWLFTFEAIDPISTAA